MSETQYRITIDIRMTETPEEAQKQGVPSMIEDDFELLIENLKRLHDANDDGAPTIIEANMSMAIEPVS